MEWRSNLSNILNSKSVVLPTQDVKAMGLKNNEIVILGNNFLYFITHDSMGSFKSNNQFELKNINNNCLNW